MTDLRDASHALIKAWEQTDDVKLIPEIHALRAALEQPVQEPVAWMVYTQDGKSVCVTDNPADFIEWRSFPLYTNPPRREWRGLTEEEVDQMAGNTVDAWECARAVEAALRSKNYD